MRPEDVIGSVCLLIREYDTSPSGKLLAEEAIANPEELASDNASFYGVACGLLLEARAELDAKTRPRRVVSAVRRMLSNKNMRGEKCPGLFEKDGKWIFCDGVRMLRLNEDIQSAPHCKNETDLNPDNAMKGVQTSGEELPLPTIVELKAYMAAEKVRMGARKYGRYKPSYCLDGGIYVNSQYLLDMMEALPGCVAIKPFSIKISTPIYFKADNGDGILCQRKPPIGTEEGRWKD